MKKLRFIKSWWRECAIFFLILNLIVGISVPVIADVIRVQPVPALGDLTNVEDSATVEGDMLYFDQVSGTWMVGARPNLAELFANLTLLDDLADVNVPVPTDGYFLYWDDAAGKWQCKTIAEGDIPAGIARDAEVTDAIAAILLDDLADTYLPAPGDQYFLYWDDASGKWTCRILVDSDIPSGIARDAEVTAAIADVELDDLANVTIAGLADGNFLSYSSGLGYWQNRLLAEADIPDEITRDAEVATAVSDHADNKAAHHSNIITITFIIDGGGLAITTGQKCHLEIPFACTITGWTILADQSGSIVIDVWKDTYANFPPTVADTITGSEKPTLSAVQKNQDLALGTWTTAVSAGDILAFNVDSASTVERITLSIRATKT